MHQDLSCRKYSIDLTITKQDVGLNSPEINDINYLKFLWKTSLETHIPSLLANTSLSVNDVKSLLVNESKVCQGYKYANYDERSISKIEVIKSAKPFEKLAFDITVPKIYFLKSVESVGQGHGKASESERNEENPEISINIDHTTSLIFLNKKNRIDKVIESDLPLPELLKQVKKSVVILLEQLGLSKMDPKEVKSKELLDAFLKDPSTTNAFNSLVLGQAQAQVQVHATSSDSDRKLFFLEIENVSGMVLFSNLLVQFEELLFINRLKKLKLIKRELTFTNVVNYLQLLYQAVVYSICYRYFEILRIKPSETEDNDSITNTVLSGEFSNLELLRREVRSISENFGVKYSFTPSNPPFIGTEYELKVKH